MWQRLCGALRAPDRMPLTAADPLVTASPATPIGHHTITKANTGLQRERGQLSVLPEVNEGVVGPVWRAPLGLRGWERLT